MLVLAKACITILSRWPLTYTPKTRAEGLPNVFQKKKSTDVASMGSGEAIINRKNLHRQAFSIQAVVLDIHAPKWVFLGLFFGPVYEGSAVIARLLSRGGGGLQ